MKSWPRQTPTRGLRALLGLALPLAAVACAGAPSHSATPAASAVSILSSIAPSAPPAPALAPMSDFQKGAAFTAWYHGSYASPKADDTLAQAIVPLGVNWIEILALARQDKVASTDIRTDVTTYSPTDDDLRHVIRRAHALGLRVLLKPHLDLADDPKHWRGQITAGSDADSRKAWFESYSAYVTHYADLAQEAGADSFAVGAELAGTTRYADQWRVVIQAVRAAYKGPLVYAANWGEEGRVEWWDAVDAIGVDAYYPFFIGGSPTVAQLTAAWSPVVARLGELSKKWDRPIIFTEIGYRSLDGAHRNPGSWELTGAVNLEEQARCYEALFDAFAGKEWFHGLFWWNWNPDPIPGGPDNTDYTPRDKPAEEILRQRFGAPPRAR